MSLQDVLRRTREQHPVLTLLVSEALVVVGAFALALAVRARLAGELVLYCVLAGLLLGFGLVNGTRALLHLRKLRAEGDLPRRRG